MRNHMSWRANVIGASSFFILSIAQEVAYGNEPTSQGGPAQSVPGGTGVVANAMLKKRSLLSGEEAPANQVPSYTDYPYRTVGRLSIQWPNGSVTGCTAASIGNQAIWTAGHCVYQKELGGWATKVKFAPAYKDGTAPFGWWYADSKKNPTHFLAAQTWIGGSEEVFGVRPGIRRDMGGVILDRNEKGETLSYVVGWLGFRWDYPYEQYYHFLGYPGDASGKDQPKMVECEGQSTGPAWKILEGEGPWMQTMDCDMGDGSSGGPWITYLSTTPGEADYLNGNQSKQAWQYPGSGVSPYFDDTARQLWCELLETCTLLAGPVGELQR